MSASPSDDRSTRPYLFVHLALQGLAFAFSFTHARDPDLGFHLATGRSILALGHVPGQNVLSFAEPEASALQSQWLAAVFFEWSYRAFGIAGPIALKCVLVAMIVAGLVETARVLGARPSAALLAGSLAVMVAAERFVERPLIFSNLAIVMIAYAVAARGRARSSPLRTRALAASSVLALSATVHLHGGVVFGFLLLVAFVLLDGAALVPGFARWLGMHRLEARRDARITLAILIASTLLAAGSLLAYHPHAIDVLTVPFQMASDPFLHANLVEFRPPTAFDPATLIPYWVLVAAVLLALFVSIGRAVSARSINARVLLPMAFGLALSLRHVRFVDLFAYLAAPGLAYLLSTAMEGLPVASSKDAEKKGEFRPPPVRGELVAVALSLVVFVASSFVVLERDAFGFGYDPRVFPIALMRDLRTLGAHGPAFVQDGWAGPYLAFRYPEERVFFHPAFECYSTRFFRESYLRTRDGEAGWDATLRQHDVRLVLMKYTSEGEARRQHGRPNLRQRLAADPDWALVTFDDHGLAFARRDTLSPRATVIEDLDVDTSRFLGDPLRAVPGLIALEARGMVSTRSHGLLTTALSATRRR